jgi:broad specificity phosphatase PhoE
MAFTDNRLMNSPDQQTLRLILVRHGQTLANEKFLLQGASDGPLTATGQAEVELLGNFFARYYVDRVISSDLQRAKDTAAEIARHHQVTAETNLLAREWDCGDWDGQPASEFRGMLKETGLPVSALRPPGGETLSEVRQRAEKLIDGLIQESMGKSVVICAHGDIMRMMLSCTLGLDIDQAQAFHFDNASFSMLEFNGQNWKVFTTNRVASD